MKPELKIRTNNELECYDLLTVEKLLEDDGEREEQWIASVYDYEDAVRIKKLWNMSR